MPDNLRLEWLDPATLEDNPNQWRVHPPAQQESLAAALREVGWAGAALYNERTGHLVDGHLRRDEALKRGDKIPVLVGSWTEAEEQLILATLDPLAAMASTNATALDALLREVETGEADLQKMLAGLAEAEGIVDFGEEPPEDPGAQIDKAEELRQKWGTERGQIWEIGKHRLMCGDSTSAENVGRLMDGAVAHILFTDPPYGVGYEGGTANARKRPGLTNDDGDAGWLYEAALSQAMPHLHDKSAFYVWFAASHVETTYAALRAAGMRVKALLIWHKTNAGFGSLNHHYKQKHEPCAYGSKAGYAEAWYGPSNEVTVWDIDRDGRNEWHPTQKAVALPTRALSNSSRRGDIVLDLFLGGASTMVAAEQLGRVCYGMEIEPKYVAVSLQRLADMGLEPRLTDA